MATAIQAEINLKKKILPIEEQVPEEFHDYLDVFLEEKSARFPEPRPWDHKIKMKDTFIPKSFINPTRTIKLDKFFKRNMEKGLHLTIPIPNGVIIFLRRQKGWKLRPFQDYRWYLNEHTIKNANPLPLISELLDKIKGAHRFTKLDVRWDTIMFEFETHSRWIKDYLNQLWCSSDCEIHRPCFKPWWRYIWRYDQWMNHNSIYGQHFPICPWWSHSHQKYEESLREQPILKTNKMWNQQDKGWIPRNDYWRRKIVHGPGEIKGNQPLLRLNKVRVPWLWKFLLKVHQRIFEFKKKTPKWPTQEGPKIRMDGRMPMSIWWTEEMIHWRTGFSHAWPDTTISDRNGWF
jgi:hypothetical protein